MVMAGEKTKGAGWVVDAGEEGGGSREEDAEVVVGDEGIG